MYFVVFWGILGYRISHIDSINAVKTANGEASSPTIDACNGILGDLLGKTCVSRHTMYTHSVHGVTEDEMSHSLSMTICDIN